MFSSRNVPLVTYVRRTLVARLAIMATVIAVAMAVFAYVAEERMLKEEIVTEARADIGELVARTREIVAQTDAKPAAAFDRALGEFGATRRLTTRGKIVYAKFSGRDKAEVREYLDTTFAEHQAVWEQIHADGASASTELPWVETKRIADLLAVHAVLLLGDPARGEAGTAEIVFIPAPAVVTSMKRKSVFTAGIVVLITLATTGILYPVVLRLTNRLVAFSRNMQAANFETLSLLGCIVAKRDSDTDEHNYRVTMYALRMGEALNLRTPQMRALTMGAFLHDVGKIAIRDDILLKPGRLTPEEFEIMKTHVRHGLDVIARSTWLREAREVVGGHHEKFGGEGYPGGLEGKEIPLTARIFAVADVFDALTSRRPYKAPLSCGEALDILEQGRGTHFDPEVVDLFAGMAKSLYEHYAHKTGSDLKAELIDMSWRYFQHDADTLI
ncbi:HD domain-containing protein [Desulfomicrobium norvegicum]|uniref:HD domain-containing protein n=1 Tax=Desulfomicrobium norvegicum (strain DSM 1741 / NCIMB 8310) TaxID=52561 RepID=A0A8G2C4Q4_DESNO|nr:HD domain-containing phosphohydrolase [Desulfomicrobium norvegicum]SFM00757.1 HD domain-containing protein [Desulfomicrobium norvegicum]